MAGAKRVPAIVERIAGHVSKFPNDTLRQREIAVGNLIKSRETIEAYGEFLKENSHLLSDAAVSHLASAIASRMKPK